MLNDRQKIALAFKHLRKEGFFARMNFKCCPSCAVAAIPMGRLGAYVFYTAPYKNRLDDNDMLKDAMYLCWDTLDGDATPITQVLREVGLKVSWNGNSHNVIKIENNSQMDETLKSLEFAFQRS
jgi:hypothetical protein